MSFLFSFSRCLFLIGAVVVGGLFAGGTGCPAWAQDAPVAERVERFKAGRAALEAERYDVAIRSFQEVVQEDATFRLPRSGAVAWWLGRAHLTRGDSAAAHAAWRRGISALDAVGTLDLRLTDAYVRSVFERQQEREYDAAAILYLRLIENARADLHPAEHSIVRRRVAQMLPLLPEEKRTEVFPDYEAFLQGAGTLTPEGGVRLAAWWRRQDPLPATERNERVIEHLERVRVAEQRYTTERAPAGFDDRGIVYVRFGTPSRVIHLDNDAIAQDGLCGACDPVLAFPVVPKNELWVYDELGRYAQFLFIERKHRYYEEATVRGLLPQEIRSPTYVTSSKPTDLTADQPSHLTVESGLSGGLKPSKEVGLALMALRDYYRQLVQYQPEYFSLLHEIEDVLQRARRQSRRHSGASLAPEVPDYVPDVPVPEAHRNMSEMRRLDWRLVRKRKETVPPTHTETVNLSDRLRVAARTARFLDEDGATRTEVFWAVDPVDLAPSPTGQLRLARQGMLEPGHYLLHLTGVRYDSAYAPRAATRTTFRIGAGRDEPTVYSMAFPGVGDRYHLALQWDQYVVSEADSTAAFVRSGTVRADSLEPLPSHGRRLALSDLVPLHADKQAEVEGVRDTAGFAVTPYPYDSVTPETKLALYLEAYHLTFGADERTRYTVEYRVERRVSKGGPLGRLGATEEAATTQSTTYEGSSRTAREYIALDLSPYADASRLRIAVRVTDEVTSRQAERTIEFDVEP